MHVWENHFFTYPWQNLLIFKKTFAVIPLSNSTQELDGMAHHLHKLEKLDYQLNTLPRRPPPPQTHLFPLKNNRLYTGILMQNIVEWSYFPYNHTNIPEFGQQGHVLTWSNLTARVVVDKRFHTAVTNLSMKGSNSSLYLEAYRVISSQTWLLTCIKWGRVRIIYSKVNI